MPHPTTKGTFTSEVVRGKPPSPPLRRTLEWPFWLRPPFGEASTRPAVCWTVMRPGTTIAIIALLAIILIAAVIQLAQIMNS